MGKNNKRRRFEKHGRAMGPAAMAKLQRMNSGAALPVDGGPTGAPPPAAALAPPSQQPEREEQHQKLPRPASANHQQHTSGGRDTFAPNAIRSGAGAGAGAGASGSAARAPIVGRARV